MISKHPDSNLLTEYASGGLDLAQTIAITTHLQFCTECRSAVESLNTLGGEMLNQTEGDAISDDLLDRVLACIENDPQVTTMSETTPAEEKSLDTVAGDLPDYVQGLLPPGKLAWRSLSPSLRVSPIPVGETRNELALHRIRAGGTAPQHDHKGRELTVVLKGSFCDEDGVYREGDFIVREPGDVHRPRATQQAECICLSVLEAPIQLTGIKKVLNPFLRFSPS